jgi:nicotinamide-nucleotide amidase
MSSLLALKSLMVSEPRWKLAVAESLTCGHVQALVGAISGASEFFVGGLTAYTLEEKVRLLRVDRGEAERANAVSAQVAEQMARGACELFGADWGVATTGYAEPAPDFQVPQPFAWWAVYFRSREPKIWSGRIEVANASRVLVQQNVAAKALQSLIERVSDVRAGR